LNGLELGLGLPKDKQRYLKCSGFGLGRLKGKQISTGAKFTAPPSRGFGLVMSKGKQIKVKVLPLEED